MVIERRRAHASPAVTAEELLRQSRQFRRWVPFALLVAAGAALLPGYRHAVGADGLAHVRIAEYYADGRLDVAINGYWEPLYSWLLAPLLALGFEPLTAGKLLQPTALSGFVEAARTGTPAGASIADGLRNIAVVEAAERAAESGERTPVLNASPAATGGR